MLYYNGQRLTTAYHNGQYVLIVGAHKGQFVYTLDGLGTFSLFQIRSALSDMK